MAQLQEEYGDRVDFKSYNTRQEGDKADKYDVMTLPTFLFIDADGKIVHKVVGRQSLEFMRDKTESLLASPN